MAKHDDVTVKHLIDYLALVENIAWARRRLAKFEQDQAGYVDLIQENADELMRLLSESYTYYSVVYDNDIYREVTREILAYTSEALEKDEKVKSFIQAVGITQEEEDQIRDQRFSTET